MHVPIDTVNQLMLRQSDRFAAERAALVLRQSEQRDQVGTLAAKLAEQEEELVNVKRRARERFAEAQLQLRLVQEAHAATLVEHGTALRDAELRADSFARELHALKIWRAGAPGPLAEGMKDAVDEANALRAEERRSHLAQQARRIPPRRAAEAAPTFRSAPLVARTGEHFASRALSDRPLDARMVIRCVPSSRVRVAGAAADRARLGAERSGRRQGAAGYCGRCRRRGRRDEWRDGCEAGPTAGSTAAACVRVAGREHGERGGARWCACEGGSGGARGGASRGSEGGCGGENRGD